MYHMILGKKSHQHRCLCVRVCVHMCCVRVCVWGGGRSATSRIALYVNLNEAVACTCQSESPEVPLVSLLYSVSYVCLPQQYIAHLQIAPDGAFIKAYQADVSMDFHPRLEQHPKVKFYARVSSRVPFL